MEDLLNAESDRVEWKESIANSEAIGQAVSAMANDFGDTGLPGYVLVGVNHHGQPVGFGPLANLDELQQKITNRLRSTKMMPTPVFDLRETLLGGVPVLVIKIDPYPVPPVVTWDGREYIRQGTTTRRASPADLARLMERRPENQRPFDQRVLRDASLADLNRSQLQAEFDAARLDLEDPDTFLPFEHWLSHRQLGEHQGGTWRPNAAAVLVYGSDPQRFVPGARIEFVRFGGCDVDSPVASRRSIAGSLSQQLEVLWAQLDANLASVGTDNRGVIEAFGPQYPPEALKELGRNLVQHRQYDGTHAPSRVEWYQDRIEFSNPGGRFGRASEGEFGEHSDYRNPTITRLLLDLGYVQQLGRGIRRARKHLERNGNPPVRVETDGFTRIIVEARR